MPDAHRSTLKAGSRPDAAASLKLSFESAGDALRRILEREHARRHCARQYAGPSRMGPDGWTLWARLLAAPVREEDYSRAGLKHAPDNSF